MLESTSTRLCQKGMPHYGSPDKEPAVRLETLRNAGIAKIPFTTGILIGIGETRLERIESLLAIRRIHRRIWPRPRSDRAKFRAQKRRLKWLTRRSQTSTNYCGPCAVARLLFGETMSIQAPPNLSPGVLSQIVHSRHQ